MYGSSHTLYDEVVRITNIYLGPAAERFVERQAQNHLNKPPEKLTEADLKKLIDWIRMAVSLTTEDSEIVEEYTERLEKLANNSHKGG